MGSRLADCLGARCWAGEGDAIAQAARPKEAMLTKDFMMQMYYEVVSKWYKVKSAVDSATDVEGEERRENRNQRE